jgi:hypothetical protein
LRTPVKNPLYRPQPAASPSPKRPAAPLALEVEDKTVPLVDLEEEATATSAPLESDDLTAKDDGNNSKTNKKKLGGKDVKEESDEVDDKTKNEKKEKKKKEKAKERVKNLREVEKGPFFVCPVNPLT